MKYDITKQASPMMPYLGKGTECIKLLVSQISPDMREVIVSMLFSALGLTSHPSPSAHHPRFSRRTLTRSLSGC